MKLAFGVTYLIAAIHLIVAIVVAGREGSLAERFQRGNPYVKWAVGGRILPHGGGKQRLGFPKLPAFIELAGKWAFLKQILTNLLDVLNSLELQ